MKERQYPQLGEHQNIHEDFLAKIGELKTQIAGGSATSFQSISIFG